MFVSEIFVSFHLYVYKNPLNDLSYFHLINEVQEIFVFH